MRLLLWNRSWKLTLYDVLCTVNSPLDEVSGAGTIIYVPSRGVILPWIASGRLNLDP